MPDREDITPKTQPLDAEEAAELQRKLQRSNRIEKVLPESQPLEHHADEGVDQR